MPVRTVIALSVAVISTCCSGVQAQSDWEWHIKGGSIADGSGSELFEADLLIRDGKIGYIGPADLDTIEAEQTVDAFGKVITPGFIDPHAHGDPFETPEFRNFLAMGVTTIVLGQDGSSPADDLAFWFAGLEQQQTGVNVAAMSGHGTLRNRAGVHDDEATSQEVDRMKQLLEQDLSDGALGMSTGLEYVPGLYAGEEELVELAGVTGRYDAMVMSHMRSEDDSLIERSLDELAAQGKKTHVHASHLKVVYGSGTERADEVLDLIDRYRSAGIDFTADTYPYAASYTGIAIVFPEWAKTEDQWRQALDERPDILKSYLADKVKQRNGPGALLFGSGEYAGNTLEEVAEDENRPFVDILMEMGPEAASGAHFVMDEELQDRIAVAPGVMISSDGSPTMRHPRGYGSFAKIIRKYVDEQQSLTLEEAVHKMSGLTARTLRLNDRGFIREGYKADLLMFDPQKVQDKATFEEPHRLAEGIEWVWVNGIPAREKGGFTGQLNGEVLKHKKN